MSAQFFGRSGKVLYGAFSIVGMAYQSQNVNNGIPDDRVARSSLIVIYVPYPYQSAKLQLTTRRFLSGFSREVDYEHSNEHSWFQ